MTLLKIDEVNHWFGSKDRFNPKAKRVLHDINLDIAQGQFVALVGPSGCGKSTLLRSILGTHPPKQGEVWADSCRMIRPNRHVGIVYQNYSLYDFLTAEENIAFGLMLDQTNILQRAFMPWYWWPLRKKHMTQAKEFLAKLDLERAIGCYPADLSGGMRQRVAIAQALIMQPKVLLLDEPFGALDEGTREDLQKMVLQLRIDNISSQTPTTIILVTHELNEAFYLCDRVVGLTQYWTCPETGMSGATHGATICYDKASDIFRPTDPRDFERFVHLKEEIRRVIFEGDVTVNPRTHVVF